MASLHSFTIFQSATEKFSGKMTNYNKLNPKQKETMAQYMAEHPNLAKNKFPNSAQGRATSKRLWEELAIRLNADGPPVKDARIWRKVFSDQKYQVKKKLSDNKLSKGKPGGGPYTERQISATEELIIEAAGLTAAVAGNASVRTFGNNEVASRSADESSDTSSGSESGSSSREPPGPSRPASTPTQRLAPRSSTPRRKRATDVKLELLQKNLNNVSDFQRDLGEKLDELVRVQESMLKVQERMLQLAEEKHRAEQASREIDLQIKKLELETLSISAKNQK